MSSMYAPASGPARRIPVVVHVMHAGRPARKAQTDFGAYEQAVDTLAHGQVQQGQGTVRPVMVAPLATDSNRSYEREQMVQNCQHDQLDVTLANGAVETVDVWGLSPERAQELGLPRAQGFLLSPAEDLTGYVLAPSSSGVAGVNHLFGSGTGLYQAVQMDGRIEAFNLAAVEVAKRIGGAADAREQVVVHSHDHITALAQLAARGLGMKTVFTGHNLGYSTATTEADRDGFIGRYISPLGTRSYFGGSPTDCLRRMEVSEGGTTRTVEVLDLLSAALLHTDIATVVSRGYADEVGVRGFAVEGHDLRWPAVLARRQGGSAFLGIPNGLHPFLAKIQKEPNRVQEGVRVLLPHRPDNMQKRMGAVALNAALSLGLMGGDVQLRVISRASHGDPTVLAAFAAEKDKLASGSKDRLEINDYTLPTYRGALADQRAMMLFPTRWEPFGLAGLTGQAWELPLLAARVGGLKDLLGHGLYPGSQEPITPYLRKGGIVQCEYGFALEALTPEVADEQASQIIWTAVASLAKAMLDPKAREAIAKTTQRAQIRALTEFTPQRMAEAYMEKVYSRLIG